GAGSAGCVLASRLSEDPSVNVLLLEAGPVDDKLATKIPAAFPTTFKTDLDWNYQTVAQTGLEGRQIYWPRGRLLGGCSSINAQVYLRGHRADFDDWVLAGNEGWDFEGVVPYFRRAESRLAGVAVPEAPDAQLPLPKTTDPHRLTGVFLRACEQTGIPVGGDLNVELEGAARLQVTQKDGRRWSVADAYLKPALGRPNLQLITGVHVARILLEGNRAVGVEYLRAGEGIVARARKEVILSAGTINSPQLLMLSGIGPVDGLSRHGLKPVVDLPGVGQNLQDHLLVPVWAAIRGPGLPAIAASVFNLARFLLSSRGKLTSNRSEACAFIRTKPGLPAPDLELLFSPPTPTPVFPTPRKIAGRLWRLRRYFGKGRKSVRPPMNRLVSISATLIKPASTGYLQLASPDPQDKPLIQANYLRDAQGEDMRLLIAGIGRAQELFGSDAFRNRIGAELIPDADTEEELIEYVKAAAGTLQHPVGTCKMGTDETAVVDPSLRVHGVEALRVVDASVIPVIPRGHINAPTIMIAERAAELIQADATLAGSESPQTA
ncbi:MAG: GMC family oxidoreductase N-terminal domain-containing protein, partial [Actinobacteria bacterium]|nr:GMC family oxidoreductase N-terminal domain-containing protein [Actinomycetota bacterium]